eukprot:Selendium_serpulae@DN3714_c0_g1_i1.p1
MGLPKMQENNEGLTQTDLGSSNRDSIRLIEQSAQRSTDVSAPDNQTRRARRRGRQQNGHRTLFSPAYVPVGRLCPTLVPERRSEIPAIGFGIDGGPDRPSRLARPYSWLKSAQSEANQLVSDRITAMDGSLTIASGLKYGGTLALYRGTPGTCHSFAVVYVTRSDDYHETSHQMHLPLSDKPFFEVHDNATDMTAVIGWTRLARSVKKACIVAFVNLPKKTTVVLNFTPFDSTTTL